MRQIILDTETTGLDPALGHRIIEIAALEIFNRRFTDRHYQQYVNPQREIDVGAMEVHGISSEFLADKPKFRDVAKSFIDFVAGAELIIHNAAFDVGFLDHELALLDLKPIREYCPVITDTLRLAKTLHPGKRNSLDALCERYQIDNAARTLHGALLDARLLAEVYLAMTRGQESLLIDMGETAPPPAEGAVGHADVEFIVLRASPEELTAHAAQIEGIEKAGKGMSVWNKPAS